jgi:hypothetical protein
MAIIKNTNNALRTQLRSQYSVDRVAKSIFCLAYIVDKPGVSPAEGKVSFSPTNKPSQVTSITVNVVALSGANLKDFYDYYTEGTITFHDKPIADNFASFKIGSRTIADDGKTVTFTIPQVLASDAISIFKQNMQLCLIMGAAPTSEAFEVIDGGYFGTQAPT